jgi:succinate dehydrogenase / fumarate reductase, membrane anchor subunit
MNQAGRVFRSDLARVRGLGSAKEGVQHWWMQRVSAIALVPLTLWFVIAIVAHTGADYLTTRAWLGSPVTLGLMVLLIGATFYHAALGLQVVVEDYVHSETVKITIIVAMKLACLILALAAIIALLVLGFEESPTEVDQFSIQRVGASGAAAELRDPSIALDPRLRGGDGSNVE